MADKNKGASVDIAVKLLYEVDLKTLSEEQRMRLANSSSLYLTRLQDFRRISAAARAEARDGQKTEIVETKRDQRGVRRDKVARRKERRRRA